MKCILNVIRILFFLLFAQISIGQTEAELKEKGSKLFEKEQYVDATPIYLQLLSLNPKSADYNFRYGTCLLYNSYEKVKAIRYLSYAVKQPNIDARAFYFYGKALHLNYQFKEAIQFYSLYLSKREKKDKRYNVEREIQMCKNGQKLLVTFTDIVVKNKKEIDKSKFFRLYDNMETVGGEILVSEEFQSKVDKKKGHVPILHFPPNAKAIYYSSYGKGDNKDIYVRRRLPNGKWGEPQILPGKVNTNEDEDYPFLHPSGDFLFFSSKGHNSMGGYDIFMSTFDPNTNSFGKPENVDFAISSPDDDLFYVVDRTFQNAYFASSRQSQNGKLHVYNVRVARVPIREVIIMGDFLSEINPTNKKMTIEVTNFTNGESIGKIKTNKVGKYSFVFPKGGKYNYEVRVDGTDDVYKFIVELPFLDEFRPLKQKAIHTTVDGEEIVKIVNLFDEEVEDGEALISEVIRKKAALDVNIDQFDLKELDAQENRDKILSEIGFNGMSIREVSNQLNELSLTEELKKKQIQQITSNVNKEIIEKAKLLIVYETTQSDLRTRIEESNNPTEKHELLNELLSLENEKNTLISEISHLEEVKNKMTLTVISSGEINEMEVLEKEFNRLIENDEEEKALALLIAGKNKILKTKNQSPSTIIDEMIVESIVLTDEVRELKQKQLSYEENKNNLHASNILLENSLTKAKKKEKESIKQKIASQKEEIELLDEMLVSNQEKIDEKNQALYLLDNNIASIQKAMVEESDVINNQSEVKQIIAKNNRIKKNSKTLAIEQEIQSLEQIYPELSPNYKEIADVNVKDDLKEKTSVIILEDYQNKKNIIQQSEDLTIQQKNHEIIQLNNEIENQLDDRLKIIESKIKENEANSAFLEEKEQIILTKRNIETENKKLLQQIDNENNLIAIEEVKKAKENQKKSFNEIERNETLNEVEKNQAKIDINNEILQEIDTRIIEVRSVLSKNPSSKTKKQELKELNKFTKELTKQNETFEREIEVLNDIVVIDSSENNQEIPQNDNFIITKENILTEISPNYLQKVQNIEQNSSFSEKEKLEALNEEDDSVLSELIILQKKVEKSIKKDSKNNQLVTKNQLLTSLIEEKQIAIKERNIKINEINNSDIAKNAKSVNEEILFEINENYEEELADIIASNNSQFVIERDILYLEQEKLKRIKEKINSTQRLLNKDNDNQIINQELDFLKELESNQIAKVDEQKRKAISSITVGEIEQSILKVDKKYNDDISTIKNSNSSTKNEEIANRELALQKKIQSELEQIEKQQKRRYSVVVELDKAIYEIAFKESIQRESDARENSTLITENRVEEPFDETQTNLEKEKMLDELENLANNSDISSIVITQTLEVNSIKSKEIKTIEETAKKAKSEEEKAFLMQKAILKQDQLNSLIASTIVEEKIRQIEKEYDISLSTLEELEKLRRTYTIRIGELSTEIIQLEKEIAGAKKKQKITLEQQKSVLTAEKSLLINKLKTIENQTLSTYKTSDYIPLAAKKTTITFNEEREIASSDEYKEYEEKATLVLEVENQIRNLEKELKEEKSKLMKLALNNSNATSSKISEHVSHIKKIEKEIEILNVDLVQKKYDANQKLPSDKNRAMKLQNLVYRGVKPLKVVAVAALLQMPSDGFSINKEGGSVYSSKNPIPVDVKNPSGLVYRVQIGAFSKPIPQDLFKEFTPVSGEKIEGTSITRYMAGFFNNSKTVVEARQSIRELGYSDAFIVAYCDGERIGFGEARRREANGTCVPKGTNELMVEVAENTAKKIGIPLKTEIEEVPEVSYNKAPGAVDADPIEMMHGLFFTVQIGVFNRPVSDEVLYNLPEILTVRLPNGQIRYNTGLFNSVSEALARRKEALARGIVGAFVVAYYEGKRIPIAQAKHILNEKGNSILQTEIAQKEPIKVEEKHIVRTDSVSLQNLVSHEEIERMEQKKIQIVTKKEFTEFPRDVLNRYNAEGAFYYDEKDKKVKSYIYKNVDDLPRLWNFVDDIDTIFLTLDDYDINLKTISIQLDVKVIPGDFMDWMLRTTYYREIKETENGLEIRIYGIEEENIENLMTEIKTFMLNPKLIEEIENE